MVLAGFMDLPGPTLEGTNLLFGISYVLIQVFLKLLVGPAFCYSSLNDLGCWIQ